VIDLIPCLALTALVGLATSRIQSPSGLGICVFWLRPFIASDALVFYMTKLVAPINMCADYNWPPQEALHHVRIYWEWLAPVGLALGSYAVRRNANWVGLSLLVSLLSLLPVLGLIPFVFQSYSTVADRYAYMAMLGPALIVGFLVSLVRFRAFLALQVCVLVALASFAFAQCRYWSDDYSLNSHNLHLRPNSSLALIGVGCHYLADMHNARTALPYLLAAIRVRPEGRDSYFIAGEAYYMLGRPDDAIQVEQDAIARGMDTAAVHQVEAQAYLYANRPHEAMQQCADILKANPKDPFVYNGIGQANLELGRYDAALQSFAIDMKLNGRSLSSATGAIVALENMKREDEAISLQKQLVGSAPQIAVLTGLANAQLSARMLSEAKATLARAALLDGTDPDVIMSQQRMHYQQSKNE